MASKKRKKNQVTKSEMKEKTFQLIRNTKDHEAIMNTYTTNKLDFSWV
jgi:hypothetical protein